ncbi:MAG TPA: alpha/beta fold hydrolase [Blastocatellia bacterium]|nr:alpha/beta fold hydrolase [Blastocatellia bacterium]
MNMHSRCGNARSILAPLESWVSRDFYVTVGDVRVRYWIAGESGPPVVLLHGFGETVETWVCNVATLASSYRVHAVDLVGCGLSDKPAIHHSLANFAAFVADFMTAVDVEDARIIGHSMGAAVALKFAMSYPDRVKALVLVSSAGLGRDLALSSRIATVPFVGELVTRPSRGMVRYFLERAVSDRTLISDEIVTAAIARASSPEARRSALEILRALVTVRGVREDVVRSVVDNLDRIATPTLVVWGRQDRLLPVAHAAIAARGIPNASVRIFEDCGHAPHIECCNEFNELVLDFLGRV